MLLHSNNLSIRIKPTPFANFLSEPILSFDSHMATFSNSNWTMLLKASGSKTGFPPGQKLDVRTLGAFDIARRKYPIVFALLTPTRVANNHNHHQ